VEFGIGIDKEMITIHWMRTNSYSYSIINNPNELLPAFDKALKDLVVVEAATSKEDLANTPFYVGLHGSFGDNHVNPRTLRAMYLGKLVCIEGIVTRCK
jgi:DNA replication licensing factor MCM3